MKKFLSLLLGLFLTVLHAQTVTTTAFTVDNTKAAKTDLTFGSGRTLNLATGSTLNLATGSTLSFASGSTFSFTSGATVSGTPAFLNALGIGAAQSPAQQAASRANIGDTKRRAIEKLLSRMRNATPFAVMSSPPTVAVGSAGANSTILTNYTQYVYAATPDDARIAPINCTVPTASSGNYKPSYITGDGNVGGWGLRFATDAPKVGVYLRDTYTLPVLVRVTQVGAAPQWVSLTSPTLPTGAGANFYEVTYDFGSSSPRILEFYFSQATQVRGFNWGTSAGGTSGANPYRMWAAPPPDEPKILVRTDSYGQIPNLRDNWVNQFAEIVGCMGTVSSSVAGQGFLAGANSNSHNALTDINDITRFGNLDFLIVAIGYNDNGQSGIQAQATTWLQQAMTLQPTAIIIVVGPWQTPTHGASTPNTAIKAAFQAVYDPSRMFWVDTISATPIYQDLSGGNATLYIGGDNVHPNTAGGRYLAYRFVWDMVVGLNNILLNY